MRTDKFPVMIVAALMGALLANLLYSSTAAGHSFYDPICCNEKDCQPAPTDAVKVVEGGYLVQPHRELKEAVLVPFGDGRIRYAPDGQYHTCMNLYAETLRCLYVPPVGS